MSQTKRVEIETTCDRCGHVDEYSIGVRVPPDSRREGHQDQDPQDWITLTFSLTKRQGVGRIVDLCASCYAALNVWIDAKP